MDQKNRMKRMAWMVALTVVACIGHVQAGLATQTYDFYCITNNAAADVMIGEQQLKVEVSDQGPGLVGFKFMNEGLEDCVITEIYFQDGSGLLLGYASIEEDMLKVDFKQEEVGNVNPKNLPGGKSIDPQFIASAAFSIEPVNPEPNWGVNPEEWVKIIYSIQPTKTFADVINELANADLRIGIHVQSFADGGSESFVNTPEPATMLLLGLGGLMLRKRSKK